MNAKKKYTIAILLAIFVLDVCETVPSVLINEISNAFSLTGAKVGLTSTAMNAGGMVAMLMVPLLQGRIRKATLLKISLLLIAGALAVAQIMPVFVLFFIFMLIVGIGAGSLDTLGNSAMVDIHPTDNAVYLGALHGVYGIAGLSVPLFLQAVLDKTGNWHTVFLVAAASYVVTFVLFSFLAPKKGTVIESSDEKPVAKETKIKAADIKDFFKEKRNLFITLISVFYSFFQTSMLAWVVRYTTVQYNDAKIGTVCISAFWIFATISRFLGPTIKMNKLKLIASGTIIGAIIVVAGILVNNPKFLVCVYGGVGLVSGFCMPVIISVATEGQGSGSSLAVSSVMLLSCIPRMLTPIILGALATGISQNATLAFAAIAAVTCAVIALTTPKLKKQEA